MRLVAQTKLGFYPAHPTAIGGILHHLRVAEPPYKENAGDIHILDPCCGEGLALKQLAEGLEVNADRVYAVELDADRADLARANLGSAASVLGPASFMGTRIRGQSFGLIYCNPPFDDELGGGKRQELTFAEQSTRLLKFHGILVLVMPLTAIERNDRFQSFLDANYEDAALYTFPEGVRKFKEVVYIGRKRKIDTISDGNGYLKSAFYRYWESPKLPVIGTGTRTWMIPPSWAPTFFEKIRMTEAEMIAAVAKSPLNAALDPPKLADRKRPPLPLYKGHVALLLASGMLDGVVEPEGEPPHVVRGTARKVDYLADKTETTNPETGAVTEKEIWSQRIVLTVRAVGADGTIRTFEDGEKKAEQKPVSEGEKDAA